MPNNQPPYPSPDLTKGTFAGSTQETFIEKTKGKIRVLPDEVSSRIAAGEMVERPASVVKELVDNSLDGGSTFITIEVEEGGRSSLRVTDDGEGMTSYDAQLACQRFATSKLHSEKELFGINTLGFRGEALHSIASVSKFTLLTLFQGGMVGTELYGEGGTCWTVQEKPASPGTQVEVKDLFFNTPGRQKFLKSVATEFSKICHTVQQAALAWPAIHFRLLHNGHTVLELPRVSSLADRVRQIYGKGFMDRILFVHDQHPGLRIEGVVVSPHYTRTSRSPQEVFVNRRPVKNTTITHAIYEAYGSFLPKGRHPAFALFVDIDPATVDVNVHPTKREVRFSNPELLHAVIKKAIRLQLHEQPPRQDQLSSTNENLRGIQTISPSFLGPLNQPEITPFEKRPSPLFISETDTRTGNGLEHPDTQMVRESAPSYCVDQNLEVTSLGQVNRTFLIAQVNSELQIVDQHTAHERVLFERLWEAWKQQAIQAQTLLIPEHIDLPLHEMNLLEEYLPELAKLGLEIERFGTKTFLVRSVPLLLGNLNLVSLIQELVQDLSEWKSTESLEKRVRAVLASFACQGAVQAGRTMTAPEIKHLITDWVHAGSPMTCPHGRRIALCFSSDELNGIFGRASVSV